MVVGAKTRAVADRHRTARRGLQAVRRGERVQLRLAAAAADAVHPQRDELRDAVTSVEPWGVTGLYDAIVGTIQTVVDEAPRTRALVLLTDGIDTASVNSPVDAASAAAALDIPLYVLSVGKDQTDEKAVPTEDGRSGSGHAERSRDAHRRPRGRGGDGRRAELPSRARSSASCATSTSSRSRRAAPRAGTI